VSGRRIEQLARLATDPAASPNEARNAAMAACWEIRRQGIGELERQGMGELEKPERLLKGGLTGVGSGPILKEIPYIDWDFVDDQGPPNKKKEKAFGP